MRTYSDPERRARRRLYYSRVYDRDRGSRSWVSTGCAKLKEARAWVDTARMNEALGPDRVRAAAAEAKTFGEALDLWLGEKEAKTSPERFETYKLAAERYWRPFFGRQRLRDISTETLRGYTIKRKRGLLYRKGAKPRPIAAVTANGDLAALRGLFRFAIRNKWLRENPADGVESFSGEIRRRTRTLSVEDEGKLLEACRAGASIEVSARRNAGGRAGGKTRDAHGKWVQTTPVPRHLYPVVLTALKCGFRRKTLLSLQWKHLDFARGEWRIPAAIQKTREDYTAPVPVSVLEELRRYRIDLAERAEKLGKPPLERIGPDALVFGLDGKRSSIKRAFTTAVARAGFDFHLSLHDCRRIYLNRLRERGVSLEAAMALTGHRRIDTVQKYYRSVDPADLRAAVQAIDRTAEPRAAGSEGAR